MRLAVLIDADNISWTDAKEVFDIAERLGEAITRRAFGNVTIFSGKDGWKEPVRNFAIEARPQVSNVDRKNAADFALVIDAMDCLYSGRYDGLVLVSSDSDFTSLAQRIRNDGKAVYGIGDGRASISFRKACTEFFELKPKEALPIVSAQPGATNPPQTPQPAKVAPAPLTSATPRQPTEFQKIVADLQKRKCKKLVTLQNWLMKNLKKPADETEKIIKAMKSRGFISIDENNKVTWLNM